MQTNYIIAILILAGIVSIALIETSNMNFPITSEKNELKIISFTIDKEVYHSNEPMNISLEIYSSNKIDNVTIKLFGIKDRRDNYRFNREEIVNLNSGENTFLYSFTTPACYGCARINPGIHEITSMISHQETNLNSSLNVDIKR